MDGIWVNPGDFVIVRWVFLRLLGVIYLIAFASFTLQVGGLIGNKGILPASEYLDAIHRSLGAKGYYLFPTLAWINTGDAFLKGLCIAGILVSLLLVFGLQTTPVLFLLWVSYLSLVTVGQDFLSFQWDVLLVEVGFLSIFLVPPSLLPKQALAPPSAFVILLFRFLLFKLIFMSGMVKLASGDLNWRNLTALAYHYETQPLPTPLAWYMQQLPLWFQKLSTLFTLATELAVPFLYFSPRLFRFVGAGFTILLQVLILLTGNYAFFNWLTIFLALFLLDDTLLSQFLPVQRLGSLVPAVSGEYGIAWGRHVPAGLALILIVTGLSHIALRVSGGPGVLKPVMPLLELTGALKISNGYGLFAVMTTERPQIIVEGSDDGENWLAYEFKYQPVQVKRAPPVVAPHQPRLDWQMWFAALSSFQRNQWFLRFGVRLLEGSPQVTDLLARNPFPDRPPKYLRAVLYDYRFTTASERAKTGAWWHREELGIYMPPISLR
ncbi:MAG TPA: lipase maturation factor family protein [Anaerolineales bacterium]|nr:lipase maturation factor family protein [Anaerolineales bacterium]